jgi:Zn-dependent protease with chaperone function
VNTALCLTVYGIVVTVAAPRWLRSATGRGRLPRLEIGTWLLAMLTGILCPLLAAVTLARAHIVWFAAIGWVLLAIVAARLTWAATATCRDIHSRRRDHGELLALLGRPDSELDAIVIDADQPLVYCLRAPRPTVVVTTGARRALTPIQLSAALAHERAHLTGRHHLLLTILHMAARAVPWLPLFAQALTIVGGLLEMSADDAAARHYGPRTVAAAICAMSHRPAPAGALGAAGPSALGRGQRLCATEALWRIAAGRLIVAVTVVALAAGPYAFNLLPLCPTRW